jgi:hypothetical protein
MVMHPLAALRRHPIEMTATLRHSLVVGFAFPAPVLEQLLPAGLEVDAFGSEGHWGLAAVAAVRADGMRPSRLPGLVGQDFDLVGYRIFCRFLRPDGRRLRGLHILRSDASSRAMVLAGNLLTHYAYRRSAIAIRPASGRLAVRVAAEDPEGGLEIDARLDPPATAPPPGSPFGDLREARRFAGPLPFTFDFEPETRSIVVIEGARRDWQPIAVDVDVRRADFFRSARFGGVEPVLANAFVVTDVPYRWLRGRVHPLPGVAA